MRLLVLSACLFWVSSGTLWAQAASEPLLGRYEVSAGASWIGSASFGSLDASLTGPSGDRFRLFSTSTALAGAPAFDVRLGRKLARRIQAELAGSYSSPTLTTSISRDAENGVPTVASESIRQIAIVGAVVVYLPRRRAGSRVLPFVSGGGGYLGQLHEGNKLAQGGRTYQVGGGVAIPVVSRVRARGMKQFGLRAEARALVRTGGVTLDGRAHTSPVVAVSAFGRF